MPVMRDDNNCALIVLQGNTVRVTHFQVLVYQNPNLLLLDEPTNHLDLEMRHALSVALQDYQGAIIIVSHDRHMLRSVTDQLYLVANGTASQFDGDLDDYRLWLRLVSANLFSRSFCC
jgi:ATPase subunit of ABC transporter with duplicated ATPase domains